MFDFDCSSCGKRQLISPSRVKGMVNDDAGIVIVFTCWCGAASAMRTGAAAASAPDVRSTLTLAY